MSELEQRIEEARRAHMRRINRNAGMALLALAVWNVLLWGWIG